MAPPGQNQNDGDLRFSATLQDNVSPTAAAIEKKLKELGATKAEIKLYLRAYDETTAKAQQVKKELDKLPKERRIRITADAHDAMSKMQRLKEMAAKPVEYTVNVKHNVDSSINEMRGKLQKFQMEAGQMFAKMPVFGPVSRGMAPVVGPMAQSTLGQIGLGFGGAGAVGGSLALMQKSIDVNSELEQSLVTLNQTLKDGAAAQGEMLKLIDFAKKTPFNYQDVLQSDVRYRQYGMNPEGPLGLKKAGDMSAALGTPIAQGTEAIADARMGYFVRMMSYGIRLTREDFAPGGKYQGQTFEQGTAQAIKRFEGAMEVQSKTLQGVMSNLQDITQQMIVQPIGQNVFSSIRQGANELQNALWDPMVQRQIGSTVEMLQGKIDQMLQAISKTKDYFMTYIKDPLQEIIASFIELSTIIAKTFGNTTATAVKYFAEAMTAILQPITAVAEKVPFLFQILGFAKALQFLGFERQAEPFNNLLAAVNPLTGSFGALKSALGDTFMMLKTGAIVLFLKNLIDLRTGATALTQQFDYLGDAGQASVDKLQMKVDLLAGSLDRSAGSAKKLVAEIAAVAPSQGKGALSSSFEAYLLKAAEQVSFTEKEFGGGKAAKDILLKQLGATKAQTPGAADSVAADVRSQILALSSSLGLSREDAAKQQNLSYTTFQDALRARGQSNAGGAYTATAVYGALGSLPVTDQQLNLGIKSPRELTDYVLRRTRQPTQEDASLMLRRGGLSKYFGISPVVTSTTADKLNTLADTDTAYKDQYTNALNIQRQLRSTFQTDISAGLPKPVNVYGELGLSPKLDTFGAAPGLATNVASEWVRMGKLVPEVQTALQEANMELGKWEVKAAQTQQAMAALNNEAAKFNFSQIRPLTREIQDIQLQISRYSTRVISPLQRAMAGLNMEMSKYQHENILPIQRAQEDWNMAMTKTSNKIADISEKMSVANYQLNKFSGGLLTGEEAWQDQMHAMDMYTKKLQLAMLQQKGFAEDLSRTSVNDGFKTTIRPLMGFSLQKQQELAETRKSIMALEGEIKFDRYDLQKAGRSRFERTEMPLETRVEMTKRWRDILDKGQVAQYELERLTYKQSLHARDLNYQLYEAQKAMRPMQDQAYNFEQSMAAASLHVSKMQEDASKLQNTLTARQQSPTARGFEDDNFRGQQRLFEIQRGSFPAQQRVGQLENQHTEVKNSQQVLGNILKDLLKGQSLEQLQEAIKILGAQGILDPEQVKRLEEVLKNSPDKHKEAAEKTKSTWRKAFDEIKRDFLGIFSGATFMKLGDFVKQGVDAALKAVGIQSSSMGTVVGTGVAGFAALATLNATRILGTQGVARGLQGLINRSPLVRPGTRAAQMFPGTFGPGGRLTRFGRGLISFSDAEMRNLRSPARFGQGIVGGLVGSTVGRWLGGDSPMGQVFGSLLGGLVGGQWGSRSQPLTRASRSAVTQLTRVMNWARGTGAGGAVAAITLRIRGLAAFNRIRTFFTTNRAMRALSLPIRISFRGLGGLARALGFLPGAAGATGALGKFFGLAGKTLGRVMLPITLVTGTIDAVTGKGRTQSGGIGTLAGAGIGGAIGLAGGPFAPISVPLGMAIGSAVGFAIGQFWPEIKKIPRIIGDFFKKTDWGNVAKTVGDALLKALKTGLRVALRLFFAVALAPIILPFHLGNLLWDKFIEPGFEWIKKKAGDFVDIGKKFIGWAARGAARAAVGWVTFWTTLPFRIVTWLTSPKERERTMDGGKKIIGRIWKGMRDKIGDVAGWLKRLPGKIKDWVTEDLVPFVEGGFKIGEAIVEGIKQGIKALKGEVKDALMDVLPKQLRGPAEKILGITGKAWDLSNKLRPDNLMRTAVDKAINILGGDKDKDEQKKDDEEVIKNREKIRDEHLNKDDQIKKTRASKVIGEVEEHNEKVERRQRGSYSRQEDQEEQGNKKVHNVLSEWLRKNRKSLNAFKREFGISYGESDGPSSDGPRDSGPANNAANGLLDPSALIKGRGDSKGYLIRVGEEDDEMIVPLASHRRGRAVSLIKQAMGRLGTHHFDNGGIARASRNTGGGGSPQSDDGGRAGRHARRTAPANYRSRDRFGNAQPHVDWSGDQIKRLFNPNPIYGPGTQDHVLGLALDFMVGSDSRKGDRIARYLHDRASQHRISYLIWKQRIWNVRRAAEGWRQMEDRGDPTQNHFDHVHASYLPWGRVRPIGRSSSSGFSGGGDLAEMMEIPELSKVPKRLLSKGIMGRMLYQTLRRMKKQVHKRLGKIAESGGGMGAGGDAPNAPGDVNAAARLGKRMAAARGWTGNEWDALYKLWQGESGWNPNAVNPSSGATGIPQLLPGAHKIPSNWSNPRVQIKWGLDYIKNRYGSPSAALDFWNSKSPHWYHNGSAVHDIGNDQLARLQPGQMVLGKNVSQRVSATIASARGQSTGNMWKNIEAVIKDVSKGLGALVESFKEARETRKREREMIRNARATAGIDPATGQRMTAGRAGIYASDNLRDEIARARSMSPKAYASDAKKRGVAGGVQQAVLANLVSPGSKYDRDIDPDNVRDYFSRRMDQQLAAIGFPLGKKAAPKTKKTAKAAATTAGKRPTVKGKAGIYGDDPVTGYHDSGDNNDPALAGATNNRPGIALRSRKTLGDWFKLKAPNGKEMLVQQTDIGPAKWTGRNIDVNAVAARRFGYGQHSFPTDQGTWAATRVGSKKPEGRTGYASSIRGTASSTAKAVTRSTTTTVRELGKLGARVSMATTRGSAGVANTVGKAVSKLNKDTNSDNRTSKEILSSIDKNLEKEGPIWNKIEATNSRLHTIEKLLEKEGPLWDKINATNSRLHDVQIKLDKEGPLWEKINATNSRLHDVQIKLDKEGPLWEKINATNSRLHDVQGKLDREGPIWSKIHATNGRLQDLWDKIHASNSRLADVQRLLGPDGPIDNRLERGTNAKLADVRDHLSELRSGFRRQYPGKGFAGGLSRVPEDNYPAMLHQDEMVLSAGAANIYRSGRGGGTVIVDTSKMERILTEIKDSVEQNRPEVTIVNQAQGAKLDSTVYKRQGLTRSR